MKHLEQALLGAPYRTPGECRVPKPSLWSRMSPWLARWLPVVIWSGAIMGLTASIWHARPTPKACFGTRNGENARRAAREYVRHSPHLRGWLGLERTWAMEELVCTVPAPGATTTQCSFPVPRSISRVQGERWVIDCDTAERNNPGCWSFR